MLHECGAELLMFHPGKESFQGEDRDNRQAGFQAVPAFPIN